MCRWHSPISFLLLSLLINSCRNLLALFPLHDLLIYHVWLIQTIPPNESYHESFCTESSNSMLHCITSAPTAEEEDQMFALLQQVCTISKAPHPGKHRQFLSRTVQIWATLTGLAAHLLTISMEQWLSVADATDVCVSQHQFAPTLSSIWESVTANGEHTTRKVVARWSSVGIGKSRGVLLRFFSLITPCQAYWTNNSINQINWCAPLWEVWQTTNPLKW